MSNTSSVNLDFIEWNETFNPQKLKLLNNIEVQDYVEHGPAGGNPNATFIGTKEDLEHMIENFWNPDSNHQDHINFLKSLIKSKHMNAIVIDIDKQAFLFDNQEAIHILPDRRQQIIDINGFTDRRTDINNLPNRLHDLESTIIDLRADLEGYSRQVAELQKQNIQEMQNTTQWRNKVIELETLRDKHVYALERYETIIDTLCKTINEV